MVFGTFQSEQKKRLAMIKYKYKTIIVMLVKHCPKLSPLDSIVPREL